MAGRGRPRKIPIEVVEEEKVGVPCETACAESIEIPQIAYLSVDYSSEGLNNMAKKINEIIERINNK